MSDQIAQRKWEKVERKLPDYLKALLASDVFGRGSGRKAPPREHGSYLFTEAGKHLYVGRCGLTERAAKKGVGHSDFPTRLAGHTRPSSGHNQATFAWRLAVEAMDGAITDHSCWTAAFAWSSYGRRSESRLWNFASSPLRTISRATSSSPMPH